MGQVRLVRTRNNKRIQTAASVVMEASAYAELSHERPEPVRGGGLERRYVAGWGTGLSTHCGSSGSTVPGELHVLASHQKGLHFRGLLSGYCCLTFPCPARRESSRVIGNTLWSLGGACFNR